MERGKDARWHYTACSMRLSPTPNRCRSSKASSTPSWDERTTYCIYFFHCGETSTPTWHYRQSSRNQMKSSPGTRSTFNGVSLLSMLTESWELVLQKWFPELAFYFIPTLDSMSGITNHNTRSDEILMESMLSISRTTESWSSLKDNPDGSHKTLKLSSETQGRHKGSSSQSVGAAIFLTLWPRLPLTF